MGRYQIDGAMAVEQSRDIPIAGHYDVIVAGGGTAGSGAAVAAGRMGAKTLLIERASYLGGTSTGGMMGVMWGPYDSYSGYCKEVVDDMLAMGAAQPGAIVNFDTAALKQIHLAKLQAAGAAPLFYSYVVDAIVEDGTVRGVVVENKSGRQAILAHTVIDATADGDVAAFSGADFQKGRSDGAMRPVTVLFRLGNVDIDALLSYAQEHPDQFMADEHVNFVSPQERKMRLAGFFDLITAGREAGELDADCHYLRVESVDFETRIALINTVRVYGIDGTDAWQVTKGELAARRQMADLIQFMQAKVPGFQNAFLVDSSDMLGVRETRHVVGEYILTNDDIAEGRQFDDVIGLNCGHLPPNQEVHSPDGNEGGQNDRANRADPWSRISHEIPYGVMLAKNVDNLLLAGRHVSATHEADRIMRHIPPCIMVGQAAGTAAALCAELDVSPKRLEVRRLQASLLRSGVDLGRPIPGLR